MCVCVWLPEGDWYRVTRMGRYLSFFVICNETTAVGI